jgi:undecaprenyl-diphosphatase
MHARSVRRRLAVLAGAAIAVFIGFTVAVTTQRSLALDAQAFEIARDLRAPWLDHVARVVTTLGLIAIVASAAAGGAAFLIWRGHRIRAAALIAGVAVTWLTVWITKAAVDRPRPPAPLVHTAGRSYPSAHAANAVGWLAIAIALSVAIPGRRARIGAAVAGGLLAILVGLSRIYLRAHYASDVIGGEALAVAIYALAAIGALARSSGRDTVARGGVGSAPTGAG